MEFEPTPAYSTFTYPAGNRPSGVSSQPGSFITPKPAADRGLGWLVLPLVVVVGLWTLFFVMRARRLRGSYISEQTEQLYRQALRELAWAGLPSRASQTPAEYLNLFAMHSERIPACVLDGLRKITHLYIQSTYSSHPVLYQDVQMNQWRWRQARGEWIILILRRMMRSKKQS